MPRRRGLRPHLLAAVLPLRDNLALGPQLNATTLAGHAAVRIDDLSSTTYADEPHQGVRVRSIGWLGSAVPRRGCLEREAIERLRYYRVVAFYDDGDLGEHVCEICGLEEGRGEFWVEWAGVRYVLPTLVLHYCETHDYLPPDEFLNALTLRARADSAAGAG